MKETLAVVVLMIVVISGLFFISSNKININSITGFLVSEPFTELSVRNVRFQSRFEEPCFVTISGAVENTGNTPARDVVANCLIEDKYKNPLGAQAQYLGDIKAGSAANFLLRMNVICIKDHPVYKCRADCVNC